MIAPSVAASGKVLNVPEAAVFLGIRPDELVRARERGDVVPVGPRGRASGRFDEIQLRRLRSDEPAWLREAWGEDPRQAPTDDPFLSSGEVSEMLGISTRQLRSLCRRGSIACEITHRRRNGGRHVSYRVRTSEVGNLLEHPPAWLISCRAERAAQEGTTRPSRLEIVAGVRLVMPLRQRAPDRVVLHLGPTNSGKTHVALDAIRERGRGVYAAPLRMLAQEVHARLSQEMGPGRVGLVTGEERINDQAPILCCTAEMAPRGGEVLVLDEVHWATDPERGPAWTRLLLGGEYRELRLAGSPDAFPFLSHEFPEAELSVHERLGPLRACGSVDVGAVAPGTAVVAFSRVAVLALAQAFSARRPGRVAVLYGAMPLEARRQEIERFLCGDAEVICATDVIGHGVNLPCRTVLFAEDTKYDGSERRRLSDWEIAQIGGRAGRYGLAGEGQVGVLTGLDWLSADPVRIERALTPRIAVMDGLRAHRSLDKALIGPRLADLGSPKPRDLERALAAWESQARRELSGHSWISISPTDLSRQRLAVLRNARLLGDLSLEQAWSLAGAPCDPQDDAEMLEGLARQLTGRPPGIHLPGPKQIANLDLQGAEECARQASILSWFAQAHPDKALISARVSANRKAQAAARVNVLLSLEIARRDRGICTDCGRSCAPWFRRCDRCHGLGY